MPEYIERETLLKHTIALNNPHELGENVVPVSDIEAAPAADVAEVVHGRWIQVQQLRGNPGWEIGQCWSEIVYQCSICERISAHKEPYCHCGARMDAKEDKQ